MKKEKLVVVGNGMAGARFVEEVLLRKGREVFDVVVFGEESFGNYNRILLSNVVAGSHEPKDILLNSPGWYAENGVTLHSGVRVEKIDREKKIAFGAGIEEPYDRLVFATGSSPFIPPIAGLTNSAGGFVDGAFAFRTLDDSLRIIDFASKARKVVVVGGGLLGLEAARGLLNRGLEVHVVELMSYPMALQLDAAAGDILRSTLEKIGIRFHLGKSIAGLLGSDRVEAVQFNDGTTESCDMFVISAGIRPNVAVAKAAGLTVERAIVVGDDLACVNDSSVHAIGECAQHRGQTYGLVAPGREQAKVLAQILTGASQAKYAGSSTSTTLKVMGVDLVVMGRKEPVDEQDEIITYVETRSAVYKKLIVREERLVGAILLGDTANANTLLRAFHKGDAITQNPRELLFATSTASPEPAMAPDVESNDEPLKEVIAVIRPESWNKTKAHVEKLGIEAFMQHRVFGRGRQRGLHFLARRGAESGIGFRYLSKRMISWIVRAGQVDALVQAIIEANWTGQIGDGKIFVLPLDGTVEIGSDDAAVIQSEDHALANA